jgi:hypothetical protein
MAAKATGYFGRVFPDPRSQREAGQQDAERERLNREAEILGNAGTSHHSIAEWPAEALAIPERAERWRD